MAAPTFVNAGTGVVETGGPASTITSGTGTAGDLLILQIFVDGTTHSPGLSSDSGVENLAGLDNTLTSLVLDVAVGAGPSGTHSIYIGRALGTGAATVDLSTSGDDMYARWYRFNGASTGTTLATVIENGGVQALNVAGDGTVVSDRGVTTNGADRLACQLVAHNDDIAAVVFTGESGGDWALNADFTSGTGTDGGISLQTATIASATTIDGGSYTASASVAWGICGFAILPVDTGGITVNAEVATGTGTANQPAASVAPSAGNAAATGAAFDATAVISKDIFAGNAAGTGTANNATTLVTANPGVAAASGAAYNATAAVAKEVAAGLASATAAALDVDAAIAPNAGLATATGTANNATTLETINAGVATASGAALTPSATIAPSSGVATGTGAANQPSARRIGLLTDSDSTSR